MTHTKKLNWKHAVLIGICTAIGAVGGRFGYDYFMTGSIAGVPSIDRTLSEAADAMNRNLPLILDRNTRLDSTIAMPGHRFAYHYTMLGIDPAQVDSEAFVAEMRPKLIAQYQTNQDMAGFRDMGVTLVYAYKSEAGVEVVQIEVSPDDFSVE